MHIVVYTLWCWHTLENVCENAITCAHVGLHIVVLAHFVGVLMVERGWVSLSLPPSLRGGIRRFLRKRSAYFSIAPVGSLEKSQECVSLRNTHWMLDTEAPDVVSMRPV